MCMYCGRYMHLHVGTRSAGTLSSLAPFSFFFSFSSFFFFLLGIVPACGGIVGSFWSFGRFVGRGHHTAARPTHRRPPAPPSHRHQIFVGILGAKSIDYMLRSELSTVVLIAS
jgi:hypothetical protein